ncbi:ABC transporter permease [Deinococcus peraridilitoris]|uniref:ABC-type transport system, involved in lipoprotein release, permease component n=1 Tax=Deinococcus peraridilitoris (strain DSM 19664 / LMG 22246 / CIP 109416 / KR-200) TaxID=937777 RepID=L0A6I1_DEIPD|nr:ABC transporter permease [Deinococcus peraridilitoris]AFZ69493.1 ABC-type transport system, involved in lipoprotein release, permease component [Deinococcus peraridilitoris DSM 19664]
MAPLRRFRPAGTLLVLSARGLTRRPARSVVTALCVSVATAGLTVFLSLGAGLRQAVEEQTNSIRPQLQVSLGGLLQALAPPPTMPEQLLEQIQAQRAALGLQFVTPVILQRHRHAGLEVTLYGVPAAIGFKQVYPYARVLRGRQLIPADEHAPVAVVGAQVARQLMVQNGDVIPLNRRHQVRIVGVLAPTGTATDAFIIIPLRSLQAILEVRGLISLAAVEVRPDQDVWDVARTLAKHVDAEVHTQLEARDVMTRLLRGARLMQWALSGVALLVAFLTVLTTMTMVGFERRAELAVLRALGLQPGQAVGLLLLDGVLLTGVGGLGGALLGWLAGHALSAFTIARTGVPAALTTPGVLLVVLAVSIFMGVLAALPVAWRVTREPIARALRLN